MEYLVDFGVTNTRKIEGPQSHPSVFLVGTQATPVTEWVFGGFLPGGIRAEVADKKFGSFYILFLPFLGSGWPSRVTD